jgi:hypothetical protein
MMEADANLIRKSIAKEHFTSPLSDKRFQLSELEQRKHALKLIEKKFIKSMESAQYSPGRVLNRRVSNQAFSE